MNILAWITLVVYSVNLIAHFKNLLFGDKTSLRVLSLIGILISILPIVFSLIYLGYING